MHMAQQYVGSSQMTALYKNRFEEPLQQEWKDGLKIFQIYYL
jgi:hypothetical protein